MEASYENQSALLGIDLTNPLGEFVVIVGLSGCGKSNLPCLIAGLEYIGSGEPKLDG